MSKVDHLGRCARATAENTIVRERARANARLIVDRELTGVPQDIMYVCGRGLIATSGAKSKGVWDVQMSTWFRQSQAQSRSGG